jgi:hypothetical protein
VDVNKRRRKKCKKGRGQTGSTKQSEKSMGKKSSGNIAHEDAVTASRDENGTDIFRPYSRPNSFRGVLIRPYPSPDI